MKCQWHSLCMALTLCASAMARVPNPRLDWQACGQTRVSYVCDPEQVVAAADRDRLIDILADAQVILKDKAVCEQSAADPILFAVIVDNITAADNTTTEQLAQTIRAQYAQDLGGSQPTTCDMVMLMLVVLDRLELSFVYSADIHIPRSRAKNTLQNSIALTEHMANRQFIVLLAEATNIVNMLLEPLETEYWLVPHPRTNYLECRQSAPSYLCDPDDQLEPALSVELSRRLEGVQRQLYSRAQPCSRHSDRKLRAELYVLVLRTFPPHATRNMTEFTRIVRDVYGWDALSQSDCAGVVVVVLVTDAEYRSLAIDSTRTAGFAAHYAFDLAPALEALQRQDYAATVERSINAVTRQSEAMRIVDQLRSVMDDTDVKHQVAGAASTNAVWFVLMAATLFLLVVGIFVVLYCCLVRSYDAS